MPKGAAGKRLAGRAARVTGNTAAKRSAGHASLVVSYPVPPTNTYIDMNALATDGYKTDTYGWSIRYREIASGGFLS